jgi:hypothetical protein
MRPFRAYGPGRYTEPVNRLITGRDKAGFFLNGKPGNEVLNPLFQRQAGIKKRILKNHKTNEPLLKL